RLFAPEWVEAPEVVRDERRAPGRWIVYGGPPALARRVVDAIATAGHVGLRVRPSAVPDAPAWSALVGALPADRPLSGVIHLDACREPLGHDAAPADIDAALATGCLATLHVTQALAALPTLEKPRLWVVTRGTQAVVA